jgi:hypothetical protein
LSTSYPPARLPVGRYLKDSFLNATTSAAGQGPLGAASCHLESRLWRRKPRTAISDRPIWRVDRGLVAPVWIGRDRAEKWLIANFDRLGIEATVDLHSKYF